MKKLNRCCVWFGTYKKQFVIWDPESHYLENVKYHVIISIIIENINIILHKKMLNAIYLYLFHNDTSKENNSLNGHSNKPWIKWIAVRYISCQVKSSWEKLLKLYLNENKAWSLCLLFFINFLFSLNDSPSKTMKNVFCFIWKALFILKIFKFLYFRLPPFFPPVSHCFRG